MKAVHWIALTCTLVAVPWLSRCTGDELPRVDTAIDLNWRFTMGDPERASLPGYDDSGWRYLSLPHDWMIEQPVAESNPSGKAGGYYPGGVAWYRKSLDLGEYREKGQFYLLFEGVSRNADIFFNGARLGKQVNGYASFYYDVTSLVRTDTLNVIAVRTDCSDLPVDRWYSGAGIYRHVRLVATDPLHIPLWGSSVTSTIDSSGSAALSVSLELLNNARKMRRIRIRYEVVSPSGEKVAEGEEKHLLDAGDRDTVNSIFRIANPALWSPGTPELYKVNCFLLEGRRMIDHSSTPYGIRTAAFDPDSGFILNGRKMMMKGVCLHHDGGELGAAVPLESWKRRLYQLKELGVNSIRFAHNPHAPEVLDLCDQMGFLVIDEMYDKWERDWRADSPGPLMEEQWEADMVNFIRRDRNHPSVVLWSVGNETVEQLEDPKKGTEIYRKLRELVLSVDLSREVTCALHPGYPERGNEIPSSMMHVSPVVSYNYRTDSLSSWHERYPDLVFIAAETKAYGTKKPANYQVVDYSDNSWNHVEGFIAGQFIWSGIDYLGESAGWPDRGMRSGLLLTNGFIKPHAWYIGSRYREDPMVKLTVKDSLLADSLNRNTSWQASWAGAALSDHWTYLPGSGPKEVVVFTNCRKVDLLLNGRLVSSLERASFPDGVIKASVPYEPGALVACAYSGDGSTETLMVTDTLLTAFEPFALALHPDRDRVHPNSGEVVHITTRVVDSAGILNPHSSHLVNYQLDGPGRIRVIDNGDLADHTPPGSTAREVRRGKQLLILQAGSEPGDLIISASAEGLKPSSVKIRSGK